MPKERREGQSHNGRKPCEIQFGITFQPFANTRRFYGTPKGREPFYISEDYDYGIALRKRISLNGIDGFIDVINDDPSSWLQSMIGKNCRRLEKPLGETIFESDYRGDGKEEVTEEPCILRFSFLTHNPGQYAKLLETFADVDLGKEKYMLVWNQNRPLVKKCMQYLEEGGKELLIVEKNLFNYKEIEANMSLVGDQEIGISEKNEFGRITFVWLPLELRKLRKIKLTFHRLGGEDFRTNLIAPNEPERELIPALSV